MLKTNEGLERGLSNKFRYSRIYSGICSQLGFMHHFKQMPDQVRQVQLLIGQPRPEMTLDAYKLKPVCCHPDTIGLASVSG